MQKFRLILVVIGFLLSFPLFGQEDPFPQYQEVGRIGNGTLQQIAWSPDGERLAVVSTIGLFLYTPELDLISEYDLMSYRADDLFWSPDGMYLSVKTYNLGDDEAHWQIYEVNGETFTPQFTQFASVTDLTWQENNLLLVDSSRLHILSLATNEVVFALDEPISQATWNATGTQLAVTTDDLVTVYDGATFEVVFSRQGFNGFWWSPDGERLAVRSSAPFDDEDSGLLVIYDVAIGEEIARLQGELLANSVLELIPQTMVRQTIEDVLLHPNGCQVIVVHRHPAVTSYEVRIWDICAEDEPISALVYPATSPPIRISLFELTQNADYFLTFDCCGSWGIPTAYARAVQQEESITLSGSRWQFSPDNRQLAVYGARQGNVDFYDADTLDLTDTYESTGNLIRSVRWSPDGENLAIGRVDSLEIIDANSKAVLAEDISFLAYIYVAGWDVSGRYLAITSSGLLGNTRTYSCSSVRVWDTQQQEFVAIFDEATSAYWLSDDAQLSFTSVNFAYGFGCFSDNPRLEVWDVETHELVSVESLEEIDNNNSQSQVMGVESPDGQYMLVSTLGKIEIWRDVGVSWVFQSQIQPENLSYFSKARWHPNSQYIFFSAYHEEDLRLFFMIADVETGTALTITGRQGLILDSFTGFAWMPDGSGFALGFSDGTVTIYEQVP